MLNQLSKNQFVKIIKDDKIEYGVVLDDNKEYDTYNIMSIGFENKNGKFLEYPLDVQDMTQNYTINSAVFDEVKENEVRRKMNIWLEKNHSNLN